MGQIVQTAIIPIPCAIASQTFPFAAFLLAATKTMHTHQDTAVFNLSADSLKPTGDYYSRRDRANFDVLTSGNCESFAFPGGDLVTKALPEVDYAETFPLVLGGVATQRRIRDKKLQRIAAHL
jgi:hypothetical protein